MSEPLQITPREVKQRLDAGEKLRLVDVREPFEYNQAHIDGSELIPMRSVPQALPSLQAEEAPLIVFCHHGMRSLQVVSWLREQGVGPMQQHGGRHRPVESRNRSGCAAVRMMKFYLKPT